MTIGSNEILILFLDHKTPLVRTESPDKIIIGLCLDMEFGVMINACYRIHDYRWHFDPHTYTAGSIFCGNNVFMQDLMDPFRTNPPRRDYRKAGAYFCAVAKDNASTGIFFNDQILDFCIKHELNTLLS